MLNQYFLNISVLVFTFHLSALFVTSWHCRGSYTPHIGNQALCQPDLVNRTLKICTGTSCSNKATNTGFVLMKNCIWNDRPNVRGTSQQQCVSYDWDTDEGADGQGAYACTNNGKHNYLCDVDPKTTGVITCDDCQP
ncbi:uncharacterized protein MELLADRAFT_124160 [Melampsora larici-populina 98AG31]|uniref:Secreted protein n=1 Tax=Melampsora larici-populina (strain 98AG31 / pathotype 3-4-7) TaxID=747676 RepID=F4RND6_MELLP|nr:uncharacterized protein MELLADRAFT_124160 [Melampsora larici-populina 98AG31]EGG06115.1 secreted protein [Melampsora larici-populina 98AG31]